MQGVRVYCTNCTVLPGRIASWVYVLWVESVFAELLMAGIEACAVL